MLVKTIIDVKAPLTKDELTEIDALENRPVIPDEDCPEMSDDEIAFYDYLQKKYKTRRITKEIVLNETAYLAKLAEFTTANAVNAMRIEA